ncbi:hypothetical protein POTOM_060801 [Populus tomentosa]|uniref:PH domain-containing protein n=1 Tax=Populus tomentosa TaxID=118781 RepID=A0A8X7XRM1_POPTO|nr:hypothetical protein POTOM_060801 [Populus tomentosa]
MTGEGSGWKIVASFEGNFPNRIKELPLDRHFDINNVKRILNRIKEKSNPAEKEVQEGSGLKTAGPEGEITVGFLSKKSAKTNGWRKRWFVLNEKTGKLGYTKKQEERHFRGVITLEECNIEEVPDEEEPPPKSSKDKKANGPDAKAPSLIFKITSKVPYKTVLKAHSAVVLKAESMADKVEWMNKISNVAQPSK